MNFLNMTPEFVENLLGYVLGGVSQEIKSVGDETAIREYEKYEMLCDHLYGSPCVGTE